MSKRTMDKSNERNVKIPCFLANKFREFGDAFKNFFFSQKFNRMIDNEINNDFSSNVVLTSFQKKAKETDPNSPLNKKQSTTSSNIIIASFQRKENDHGSNSSLNNLASNSKKYEQVDNDNSETESIEIKIESIQDDDINSNKSENTERPKNETNKNTIKLIMDSFLDDEILSESDDVFSKYYNSNIRKI